MNEGQAMKKVCLLFFAAMFPFFCVYAQKTRVVLTGDLPFSDGTEIRLIERGPNRYQDTSYFEHGKFQFILESDTAIRGEFTLMWSITANEAERSRLVRNREGQIVPNSSGSTSLNHIVFINSAESPTYHLQMKDPMPANEFSISKRTDIFYSWEHYPEVLSESPESWVYSELRRLNGWSRNQRLKIMDSLYQASSDPDKIPDDFASRSYVLNDSINEPIQAAMARDILERNPGVATATLVIFNTRSPILKANSREYELLLEAMDPEVKASPMYHQASAKLRSVLYLDIGVTSPLPTGTNPEGKTVELHIGEYNYTLLEFWASWCAPCREMNPAWNKLLAESGDKSSLQIVGVSLDENAANWKQTIIQDQLIGWQHISDLKGGFRGENGSRFAIESIPFNILLDKEGKIIHKNIKPAALKKLLLEGR